MTEKLLDDCVLRYLQTFLRAEYGPQEDVSQTYDAIQDIASTWRPQQDDASNDFAITQSMKAVPPRIHPVNRRRVDSSERQKSQSHTPFLLSSLPSVEAGSDISLQDDVLSSLPRSPPSAPLPDLRPQSIRRHQQGQDTHKGMCDSIFRPVEDYIVKSYRTCDTLNNSFLSSRPSAPQRSVSEGTMTYECNPSSDKPKFQEDIFEVDAKTLLLGDVAENGAWWLGKTHAELMDRQARSTAFGEGTVARASSKTPRIDWVELHQWYQAILTAGRDWRIKLQNSLGKPWSHELLLANSETRIEAELAESCKHLRKTLFKATEALLQRPKRPLQTLTDCRFLLLLLQNPLLYSVRRRNSFSKDAAEVSGCHATPETKGSTSEKTSRSGRHTSRSHTGIIKRLLGLMANLSPENHRHLVGWLARYASADFRRLVDLVGGFVAHRLLRQRQESLETRTPNSTSVVVPQISGPGAETPAQLHAALGTGTKPNGPKVQDGRIMYREDWQMKAAAKFMSLLFQANNNSAQRHHLRGENHTPDHLRHSAGSPVESTNRISSLRARKREQLVPTSAFYNSLLDYCDLIADFEAWENRQAGFSFCQYPMFLSLWAKIRILEYDARRQMEIKARQAFFSSIMSRKAVSQYLVLKVRRECLVEDSLRGVREVVGSGDEDIKKGLRITFQGEEGVDAGGLRKEWFLLLVREVFDPEHGLFIYDEESHYCYFNPNSFETSDQFFLIGVVLGLAIYNSTILDVALPTFLFRKLLANAPAYTGPATSLHRPSTVLSLDDLAELRPSLAAGLQQLLDYDGDVEETFCRDFIFEGDRYGQAFQVPLCHNGENRAVTNSNRVEFVELYVKYLLEMSVSRQFEPFKRGFFTVCGGNALSLFRPEEIELLVRGSDEPLEVATLRAVAIYDGWKHDERTSNEAVLAWFWDLFTEAAPNEQRALLSFITGSDRLPAMGATSLIIKLSCLGNDTQRFPIARTCFNMIGLYRYSSREQLSSKLWTAVAESEGFGLK
ncbi:MAG: hypothetical protein Q9184_001654 [Pyrenodesmia sp. 2 TL-2023]